mmetsp:Transcript_10760/g.32286  ORF Transcript_10760/g.32286 Transcript_10760/m.32286 type:complete len:250 (-) Transcript_10760:122-871(-)
MHPLQSHQREVAQHAQHVGLRLVEPVGRLQLGCSAGGPQVVGDVRLVNQSLQVVEHAHHRPHRVLLTERHLPQGLDLRLALHGQLAAVLGEVLELVHELVDHVPQPAVGQLHVDVAVNDDPEQCRVVGPRLTPCLQAGLLNGIQVPVVHLLVKHAENVVVLDQVADCLHGRPGRLLEEPLTQLYKRHIVHGLDLPHVPLPDMAVEVHHELLNHVRNHVHPSTTLRRAEAHSAVLCLGSSLPGSCCQGGV